VWDGGASGEPGLLASCYRRSLEIGAQHGATSIAFPSISTGVYGYPRELAAPVALATVRETLAVVGGGFREVIFCCFSKGDLAVYERLLAS
jgi:O-acetyl-ADP-ribose deacetylase (regulator of RNase III)